MSTTLRAPTITSPSTEAELSRPLPEIRPRLSGRAAVMLALASVTGAVAFLWPLFLRPGALLGSDSLGRTATPFVMAAIMAVVLALLISELSNNDLDVKALAMLGVLTAIGAVVRPLSAGTAGIETVFFLMILAGRVFGPSFGFMLGTLTMFASALMTGGVGTWLPYQMLAAGFVGLFPGLLPRRHPRPGSPGEIVMLGGYGFLSAFLYGYLMDFAFWPFAAGLGAGTQGGFDPDATPLHNIHTFLVVNTVTSLGWNLGRAITNVVLVTLLGHPLLRIMRRTARQGSFRDTGAAEHSSRDAGTGTVTRTGRAGTDPGDPRLPGAEPGTDTPHPSCAES